MNKECRESMAQVEEAEVKLSKSIHQNIKFENIGEIINTCEAAVNAHQSNKEIRERLAICKLLCI